MSVDAAVTSGSFEQDGKLLAAYVSRGSSEAFDDLVRRHGGMVYAVCLRELGDRDLADDASQTVFVLLARKASGLRRQASVAAWLFQAARFASGHIRRDEARRRRREAQAAIESARERMEQDDRAEREFWERTETLLETMPATRTEGDVAGGLSRAEADQAYWGQAEPLLNGALAALSQSDRAAVLLRFLEGLSLRETGTALGITEDAARMRVSRAIARMRRYLAKHGLASADGTLSAVLLAKAIAEPPAWGAHGAHATLLHSSSRLLAAGRIGRAMSWLQWKGVGLATVGAVAVMGGLGSVGVHAYLRAEQPKVVAAGATASDIARYSHAVSRWRTVHEASGGRRNALGPWRRQEAWFDAQRGIYQTETDEAGHVLTQLILPDGTTRARTGGNVEVRAGSAKFWRGLIHLHRKAAAGGTPFPGIPQQRMLSSTPGVWRGVKVTIEKHEGVRVVRGADPRKSVTRWTAVKDARTGLVIARQAFSVGPTGEETPYMEADVDYGMPSDPKLFDARRFENGAKVVQVPVGSPYALGGQGPAGVGGGRYSGRAMHGVSRSHRFDLNPAPGGGKRLYSSWLRKETWIDANRGVREDERYEELPPNDPSASSSLWLPDGDFIQRGESGKLAFIHHGGAKSWAERLRQQCEGFGGLGENPRPVSQELGQWGPRKALVQTWEGSAYAHEAKCGFTLMRTRSYRDATTKLLMAERTFLVDSAGKETPFIETDLDYGTVPDAGLFDRAALLKGVKIVKRLPPVRIRPLRQQPGGR